MTPPPCSARRCPCGVSHHNHPYGYTAQSYITGNSLSSVVLEVSSGSSSAYFFTTSSTSQLIGVAS